MSIRTEVEHIFRVLIFSPKEYHANTNRLFMNHPNCISSQKINYTKGRILWRVEFQNVLEKDYQEIRKYCREQVKKHSVNNPDK